MVVIGGGSARCCCSGCGGGETSASASEDVTADSGLDAARCEGVTGLVYVTRAPRGGSGARGVPHALTLCWPRVPEQPHTHTHTYTHTHNIFSGGALRVVNHRGLQPRSSRLGIRHLLRRLRLEAGDERAGTRQGTLSTAGGARGAVTGWEGGGTCARDDGVRASCRAGDGGRRQRHEREGAAREQGQPPVHHSWRPSCIVGNPQPCFVSRSPGAGV